MRWGNTNDNRRKRNQKYFLAMEKRLNKNVGGIVAESILLFMFAMFIDPINLVSSKYISFNDTPQRMDAETTARFGSDEPSVPGAFPLI